jgi:hypothetical protein
VDWPEVFIVFVVSHLVGDFALQTEWQAENKRAGLGSNRTSRRALVAHVLSYTLAFVPAFVWLWESLGPGVLALAALLAGTHMIQDDARLLEAYVRAVKHTTPEDHPVLMVALDQTFHVVVLLGLALVAAA